jgi:hypothetical protein
MLRCNKARRGDLGRRKSPAGLTAFSGAAARFMNAPHARPNVPGSADTHRDEVPLVRANRLDLEGRLHAAAVLTGPIEAF